MTTFTATYSPDDNKLRLSASSRLEAETYARVKAAGFAWAPKQEIFVAPAWTPSRADLCIELAGEIEDEDKSLIERAEERAERFEEYSSKRGQEATSASEAVQAIAGRFEFGQPILVGHHSERKARKDAERMDSGMRKAVQLWETSSYWEFRAAGALAHAKYKELPAVRARRIKGLEADKRKRQKQKQEAEKWLTLWTKCSAEADAKVQHAAALVIAGACWLYMPRKSGDLETFNQSPNAYDVLANTHPTLYASRTVSDVLEVARATYPAHIAYAERWLAHLENRLAYERAMLGESGGLKADKFDIQPGGRVLVRGEWATVLRVTKRDGKTVSVRTNARFVPVRQVEEINDYTPPTADEMAATKAATKLAPLVNFPVDGFLHMTAAEYAAWYSDGKGTRKAAATAEHGAYRFRMVSGAATKHRMTGVYLTDAKRVDLPAPLLEAVPSIKPAERACAPGARPAAPIVDAEKQAEAEKMEALRKSLAAGVQVVVAPQLFPTPDELAARVVSLAGVERGMRVLEPSAGTGNILRAIRLATGGGAVRTAVELNGRLCDSLRTHEGGADVFHADFLSMAVADLGRFDRIVMNPPFSNGEDIKHIEHALTFLKPGGRLVAICANGPRQNARLGALAVELGGYFEALPEGSFVASGTNVRAALFVAMAPVVEDLKA